MYFPSKKDWWLTLIIWVAMGSSLWQVFQHWPQMITGVMGKLIIAFTALITVFVVWSWFRTGYLVTEKDLVIEFGPFRQVASLSGIRAVRRSRNPLAAPAWSLDRLLVEFTNGSYFLISPADKEGFLKLLKQRSPRASIEQ